MGFPLSLAIRYARSRKRAFVSIGTLFAIMGVLLGVAALTIVVSVTGGFLKEFQDKVLGVNAHVLVLKYASDFREYREVMSTVEQVPGVTGVAPFVINPMMVTHGEHTATGVLLKGVDPARMPQVLDLPKHIVAGSLDGLRKAGTTPPKRQKGVYGEPWLDDISSDAHGTTIRGSASPSPSTTSTVSPLASAKTEEERHAGLLKEIKRSIEEKTPDSAANEKKAADEDEMKALPADAPVGNVEPAGGYKSTLPEEDVLPADIALDPCSTPESIQHLPGIVIGKTLKENLHAGLGDCIQVTSPTPGYSYSGGVMRAPVAKQFRVIAIFDAGFDQYDSKLVYTDLYEAQAFYDTGDSVTGVEMKLADVNAAKQVAREIERRLDNGIYHTMDWEELNHGLFTALRIQQLLISFVLALIIIVAAFTVIATLIMVVLEKKREIAVLKTMGAKNSALLRAFLYQGGFIGLFGTVLGLITGYGACKLLMRYEFPLDPGVYFISHLPVRMTASEFALVGAFSLLVCLVATIWPAMHAARLRPADAFREHV